MLWTCTSHSSSWSSSRGSSRGSSPSAGHRLQTGPGWNTAGGKPHEQRPSWDSWQLLIAEGRSSKELRFPSAWHSEESSCWASAWTRARSPQVLLTHWHLLATQDHVHKQDTNQQAPTRSTSESLSPAHGPQKKLPGGLQNSTHPKMTHFHLKNDSFAQDHFCKHLFTGRFLSITKPREKAAKTQMHPT